MDKSGQELLRENIRSRLGRRTQRALARAIGVSDGTVSDFLNGRQMSLDLDLYRPIAKFLECEISDLFLDPSTIGPSTVTSYVPPSGVESASNTSEGANYGAEVVALRAENQQLRDKIAGNADLLKGIAESLASLATRKTASGRIPRPGTSKSKSR